LAALLACGGLVSACGDTDDRPPVWSYLSPAIFQPNCATASCHSEAAAVAGLDFSTPHSGYLSLTRLWVWVEDPTGMGGPGCGTVDGTVVCDRKSRPLVTPYDPAASRLINMLRARNAQRMPPDRPLVEADIRLVEKWILNGAKSDTEADSSAPDAGAADAPDAGDARAPGQADGSSDGMGAAGDGAGDAPRAGG
jgi:hypothetical protein